MVLTYYPLVIAFCDKLFGDHARKYDLSVWVELIKVLVYNTRQQMLATAEAETRENADKENADPAAALLL